MFRNQLHIALFNSDHLLTKSIICMLPLFEIIRLGEIIKKAHIKTFTNTQLVWFVATYILPFSKVAKTLYNTHKTYICSYG